MLSLPRRRYPRCPVNLILNDEATPRPMATSEMSHIGTELPCRRRRPMSEVGIERDGPERKPDTPPWLSVTPSRHLGHCVGVDVKQYSSLLRPASADPKGTL